MIAEFARILSSVVRFQVLFPVLCIVIGGVRILSQLSSSSIQVHEELVYGRNCVVVSDSGPPHSPGSAWSSNDPMLRSTLPLLHLASIEQPTTTLDAQSCVQGASITNPVLTAAKFDDSGTRVARI
jgi:hypothetical protein